jgi:putative ABC transport system substrate-binding protein
MNHPARWRRLVSALAPIATLGRVALLGLAATLVLAAGSCPARAQQQKVRIFVVSSNHREYLWSQDTNRGLCAALLKFGYLDSEDQARQYTRDDYVESSHAIVKKAWMDTKHHPGRDDIASATAAVLRTVEVFQPDVILLGGDNAANYVGNNLIDTDIPVVFWGINGLPLKYGLLDSLERPGHNVTGTYQAGYLAECVHYLKELVPAARTFAILSDDSETGRSKAKELQELAQEGKLALEITATVVTNSFAVWKSEALRLQPEVDAFFVLNHNTIQDEQGRVLDQLDVGAWYLQNIHRPDCAQEKQFAVEGLLLTVDDSGFKQAFDAMTMADEILRGARRPGEIPVRAPARGPIIVNRERARMLGLDLAAASFVEEFVDSALALHRHAAESETRQR